MKNKTLYFIIYTVSIISFLGILFVYPRLPDTIPTHWNISGEIDAVSDKNIIFLLGALPFLFTFLFQILPKLDPKRENYAKHRKAYEKIIMAVVFLLILLDWFTIAVSFNIAINIIKLIPPAIGILFLILGNYMPTIKSNYFFGIRNPWTLANETVWKKTHKLGGYTFIICGLLFILIAFFPTTYIIIWVISIIFVLVLYVNIYSYIIYKKISEQ